MKIYLAARYSEHPRMQGVRDVLEAMGHNVTSRWIDLHNGTQPNSAMQDELNDNPGGLCHFGQADIADIDAAEVVISFTEAPGGKGGRHVEFGYALGTGKRIILVGPREHIFHTLPEVEHYPDWPRLVMALA